MSRNSRRLTIGLIAMAAGSLWVSRSAWAEERQFLVILANSRKQCHPPCTSDQDCFAACPDAATKYECSDFGFCVIPCNSDNDCPDPACPNSTCGDTCDLSQPDPFCALILPPPQPIADEYFDDSRVCELSGVACDTNVDCPGVQEKCIQDGIGSFAEYWEEISYGDVRITGEATGEWLDLPWGIGPMSLAVGVDLEAEDAVISPTSSNLPEVFNASRAMVIIDLDGDPNDADNGPFATGPGSFDIVWRPGERFLDMDGDGKWDALDEARNQMDFFTPCGSDTICAGLPGIPVCDTGRGFCVDTTTGAAIPDGIPDLRGPWIDLNGDGAAENDTGCVYLPDGDNDGNPDCCPDGPGIPGCEPFPDATACPATTWDDAGGNTIIDCNGNLIDDAIDIATGTSIDVSPMTDDGNTCVSNPDNIPDECQFVGPFPLSPGPGCRDLGADPLANCAMAACVDLLPGRTPVQRCEFDDANGDGELDIVEPFENSLRRWDVIVGDWVSLDVPVCVGGAKAGQLCSADADCAQSCVLGANDGDACTIDNCNPDGSVTHIDTTLSGQCCNPISGDVAQIDDSNVSELSLDWFVDLPGDRGLVSTPLVVDGTLYFIGSMNVVRAVDATSGAATVTLLAAASATDGCTRRPRAVRRPPPNVRPRNSWTRWISWCARSRGGAARPTI
ncbi:MAG: hypothetical protein IH989_06470, partial [Planctomycetes bacterium]|nr:hypothetical protein [Planctomycetota bacterium]